MIRLRVIRLKDIIKIIKLISLIITIMFLVKMSFKPFLEKSSIILSQNIKIKMILSNILVFNIDDNKNENFIPGYKKMLLAELPILNLPEIENENQELKSEFTEDNFYIKPSIEKLDTKVINENNKNDIYTKDYLGIKIKNESKYELTDELLDYSSLNINHDNIIIYHTHTCESYTPTEQNPYVASR